jgi:hypothetical protein
LTVATELLCLHPTDHRWDDQPYWSLRVVHTGIPIPLFGEQPIAGSAHGMSGLLIVLSVLIQSIQGYPGRALTLIARFRPALHNEAMTSSGGRRRRFRAWVAAIVGTGAVLVWVLPHFFRSDASHVVLLILYGVWLVLLLCLGWSAYQNAVEAGRRGRDTDR